MKKRNTVILVALGLAIVLAVSYGSFNKQVTIKDDGNTLQVTCLMGTVEDVLRKQEIFLGDKDYVIPEPGTPVKDGLDIEIKRAVPVSISADGGRRSIQTVSDNVRGALADAGIKTMAEDIVKPGPEEPVKRDMDIEVIRVTRENVTVERSVPFETDTRYDDSMYKGMEQVLEKGAEGLLQEEIMICYHDGEEIERCSLGEELVRAPVNRVVAKGTVDAIETSRGEVRFKRALTMSATAYDATFESTGKTPDHPQYGITRSGTKVKPGVVAVDPKVIPLGTKLYVKSLDDTPDYGFASAEDTGGAIKGNKIDLYFELPEDVKKYGRRNVLVYILDN